MTLDAASCYRALAARDARFDGRFFVGVTTTGVYCRPICPARTPGASRCRFFTHAALAEREGFRACFRCRPELSPGLAPVDAVSRLVRSASARIEAGALADGGVDALAAALGVTARHLRRAMRRELGVGPLELGASVRLALAKQLVQGGESALVDVALASGFSSLRRFNAAFRAEFGCAPSALRRGSPRALPGAHEGGVVLRLGYRPPFDWALVLRYLAARTFAGIEQVDGDCYRRTVAAGDARGVIAAYDEPARSTVRIELSAGLVAVAQPVAAIMQRMLDLRADPAALAPLRRDPALRVRLQRRPGIRIIGAFEPFELAVRALLGQQVSVAAATTLAGRVAARFAEPIATGTDGLSRLPLRPDPIARASVEELAALGMPGPRAAALRALAAALQGGEVDLGAGADPDLAHAALCRIRGIGPWTASYIALRALGAPDAFPDDDLGLRRALGVPTRAALAERALAWRPWRGYAAMLLWNEPLAEPRTNTDPERRPGAHR